PDLPAIATIDVRSGGPVAHAMLARERMTALRNACFSFLPGMRTLAPALDRVSSAWLARTPSPCLDEIAAISGMIAGGGVWFVNASYEWGCTTRIDAAPVAGQRMLAGSAPAASCLPGREGVQRHVPGDQRCPATPAPPSMRPSPCCPPRRWPDPRCFRSLAPRRLRHA
ncbi:MAG: hypothetical protein J2P53_04950, partial [Bradyrhizobiaceae bacterium]|nr:hypothetical protein [Bradyrhizobiaceae bacterium]